MNPTPSKFKKLLLPITLILVALAVLLITWKWKDMSNQQAALYNTNAVQYACMIQIGSNGLPLPGVPSVRVISPNGNQQGTEVYYSGQTIVAKWSKCSIPTGSAGSLVLTKIGGSGPATYGPYPITIAQSSYSILIPTLPGIFNGNNAISGAYRATVTYGATTDSSDNLFFIQQSPRGVAMVHGGSLGSWAMNGQNIATLSIDYPLRALGGDIYLDKDVLLNAASSATGGQQITMKEYITTGNGVLGAQTVFDAQVTTPLTITVITPNVPLLPGGTYKIPAGQVVIFKVSTALRVPVTATAPYHRAISMIWNGFGFSTSDTNGSIIEPNYEPAWGPVGYLDLW